MLSLPFSSDAHDFMGWVGLRKYGGLLNFGVRI